jgi:hypothetical protein
MKKPAYRQRLAPRRVVAFSYLAVDEALRPLTDLEWGEMEMRFSAVSRAVI